jgi:CheY-like chemotaxis protein
VQASKDRPIRVLFAEDALDQALLVKAFLQSAPAVFQITHSQDGDHAAKLLRQQEWDLFITDLNLPGLDGFELCRIARSVHPSLAIMAITGYTGTHYQEEAYRAGATEVLTKPLDSEDFVRKVADLVGRTVAMIRPAVLAVGGLVGDVEMGCGATLLKYRRTGADVMIVPLCRDDADTDRAGLEAAQEASRRLGARLMIDEAAMESTDGRVSLVKRVAKDFRPQVLFVPAMDDEHPARREAFRIAKSTLVSVPLILGYQTATTAEFRPTRLEEVGDQMMDKLELLTAYQDVGTTRMDLAPRMAQAYARYWGRMKHFAEVEAFEVIRS